MKLIFLHAFSVSIPTCLDTTSSSISYRQNFEVFDSNSIWICYFPSQIKIFSPVFNVKKFNINPISSFLLLFSMILRMPQIFRNSMYTLHNPIYFVWYIHGLHYSSYCRYNVVYNVIPWFNITQDFSHFYFRYLCINKNG